MLSHKLQSIRDPLLFYGNIFSVESIIMLLRSKTNSQYYVDMMNLIRYFLYPVTNKDDVITKILPHIKVIEKTDLKLPLNNSNTFISKFIENCDSLEKLHLPDKFNMEINLPASLKTVVFGYLYNQAIGLPENIKKSSI